MRKLTKSEQEAWRRVCDTIGKPCEVRFVMQMHSTPIYKPSKMLDLHGLTVDQAYDQIQYLISQNIAAKQYDIVIITGKGQGGMGELRRLVPLWFETSLGSRIQKFVFDPKNQGQILVRLKKK